jgi:dipeptidyl aminopeptidase/acylaminoacyl peptidase
MAFRHDRAYLAGCEVSILGVALAACSAPASPGVAAPTVPVRPAYSPAALASLTSFEEVALASDGTELAFTTDRSGAFELWTMSLDPPAPALQRTRANEHVSGLAYAPGGSQLLFLMDHGGDERPDVWLLRRDAMEPEPLLSSPWAEIDASFGPDGRSLVFARDPERPFRFNIHRMELASGEIVALTREPVNVLSPRWSRDGRTIAAVRTGDDVAGELAFIDVATGQVRWIAPPRPGGIFWPAEFLADGRLLGQTTNDAGFLQLAIVDATTGSTEVFGDGQWDVEHDVPVAEDGTMAVSHNVRGESRVAIWTSPSASPRVLSSEGVVTSLAMDRHARTLVMLRETSNRPLEIVAVDVASGKMRTLASGSSDAVKVQDLARAERRSFVAFDGRSLDAFVWKPPVYRLGAPPPLVVHVHGGPNSQTRPYFYPELQALAEAGFLVASANYRGSAGYGRDFEDLNNHDWGGGDLRDILALVDSLAQGHEIDRARAGILGGSYGGYLVLRAITAAPGVFAAAVDLYGMPDLEVDYRITEDRFGSWYQTEMGNPNDDATRFRERSPIHMLDRVRAALLVLQGENDTNVPRAESDLVVRALRDRGREVEYVVYPNEGHGFTHREHRVDAMSRIVRFFVRHLGGRLGQGIR